MHVNDSGLDAAHSDGAYDEANLLHTLMELNITSRTRLVTDFDILESLGKGGFGDVIKVFSLLSIYSYYLYT